MGHPSNLLGPIILILGILEDFGDFGDFGDYYQTGLSICLSASYK